MVPTFALSLSFEGITLLRRGPDGWAQLDHVAADDPDLGAAMARLRDRATSADAEGDAVLLLLPEAQVRYLDLPAPGSDQAGAARTAMQGASPYALSDLTIDHVTAAGTLYVAAVANETLAEAESFARAHGFRPVGFAALPPEGAFHGTALFGTATSWTGPAPDRPQAPAIVVPAGADAPATGPAPAATGTGAAAESPTAQPGTAAPDGEPDGATTSPPTFASRRAVDTQPAPESPVATAKPAPSTPDKKQLRGSASTAAAGAVAATPPDANPSAPARRTPTSPTSVTPIAVQGAAFRERILDRARQAEALAAERKNDPPPPGNARGARSERRHLAANGIPGGLGTGKGRKVGLGLTAALLLLLALVAGWSLLDTPSDEALPPAVATLPAPETTDPQDAPPPLSDARADRDGAPGTAETRDDVDSAAEEGEETALAPVDPPPLVVEEDADDDSAAPDPVTRPLSEDEAAATYAATGIWQRAPEKPARPETGAVEDLYVASIDPDVQQFDAVALPPVRSYDPDAAPAEPGLPPPPGVTFTLDDRGLVAATPEGALTPDGHRVFLGAPPATPPLRDTALPEPQSESDEQAGEQAAQALPAPFEGIRPSARPGDVVEQNERATLQGLSRDELAAFRPALRPGTAQDQAAIDTPAATDEAVTASLPPERRPSGFDEVVEAARESPRAPTATAAAPPRTVNPDIPSSAEVARAATVRNAINLSDTALFGIYGAAADRRALVRLPNGNYEKVKVGDRLDGGEVLAISETELRYRKRGQTITLELPQG